MAVKTFTARREDDYEEALGQAAPFVFEVAGVQMSAEPPPNSGPITYLLAKIGQDDNPAVQAAALLRFVTRRIGDEHGKVLEHALEDGEINLETLFDLFQSMVEEWSDRPTSSPPASTASRRRTGRPSTASARSTA